MKHIVLSLLFILAVAGSAAAQGRTVTGVVLDEEQVPLIGANILLKNSTEGNVGTITDFDGRFAINVSGENDTLVFSYTGFIPQEVAVGNQSELQVILRTSSALLEEVIVLGYGVQKKKVATGSISRISSENIEGVKFQDVQSALEGQVSGIIVNESSGQPGAGKSILIRGISTNGDNSPLFIVDGLQVSSISNISPGDIESIDVLKDAASTAIYGARAANGVVIVTTKKGTDGVGRITYEGYASVDEPWKLPEMLGADDYVSLTREKFANGNQLNALETLGFPNVGEAPANTDWMDVIFEPAYTQNHRISVAGSNAFLSLEYWDQNGVIGDDKSNYKKYAARLNSTKPINDYVTIGENLFINRVENNSIGVNNAFGTVIADAFAYDPITPLYNDNEDYGFAQSTWVKKEYINPLSRLFISNPNGHSDQIAGNVYLEVMPLEGLTFRSDLGLDYTWNKFRSFTPDYVFHDAFFNLTNDISQGFWFGESLQFENYLKYERTTGPHNYNFVLGTSYRESSSEWGGGSSQSIPDAVQFNPNWQYVDAGQDSSDLAYGGGSVEYALISYFGRLLYDYDRKYLFSATLRRDGSSNFGANNRWGMFPSFSAGWVISEESFFNAAPISFLKVRASWGKNGNDRISPLAFAATIENVFTYAFGESQTLFTGAALATPPNPNIKWEESVQLDVGVEARFFNDQLTAEVDYYIKNTEDLLMSEIIPGYVGATNNPISNLGEIQNKGIEAALTYKLTLGDLQLTSALNYTTFTNEVIRVAGEAGFLQGWGWPVRNTAITRMTEGFPVGHFVGYRTNGIFQSEAEVFSHINSSGDLLQPRAKPGDLRFVDVNGDGVINSDDISDIGSPWPDHILGLSLGARYRGFDLSLILSAQLGHDLYRTYERSDVTFTNYQSFWLDRWTESNPSSEYPRLVSTDPNNNQRPSDFYVEDGSFFRMRNLQIGYSLPGRLLENWKLSEVRVYLTANNLFTITNYNGFDPDIGTNGWILDTGIDKGYYPTNRSIGGGIKITM